MAIVVAVCGSMFGLAICGWIFGLAICVFEAWREHARLSEMARKVRERGNE